MLALLALQPPGFGAFAEPAPVHRAAVGECVALWMHQWKVVEVGRQAPAEVDGSVGREGEDP